MPILLHDIETRDDILLLIRQFYTKLLSDPAIAYIFIDVAKMDLEAHIPLLADFWQSMLLQQGHYQKNVMQLHLQLNQQTPLQKHHFDTWLRYFNETVDALFIGEKAFLAKQRALSIATSMQIKIAQV